VYKIEISEREQSDSHTFKQIWATIFFGNYSSASMHIIGGDIDGSQKDWIEGAYAELVNLKKIFEITDDKVINVLDKKYNKIIFDPNGETHKKIMESLKPLDEKTNHQIIQLQPSKEKWIRSLIVTVIGGLIIAGIVYLFGWN
jgi:hypothetical protein